MKHIRANLNDSAVKAYAKDKSVLSVTDSRYQLELRFHKSREKATWNLRRHEHGQTRRHRIAYWPALNFKNVLAMLPDVLKRIGAGQDVQVTEFKTVNDLFNWYLERVEKESVKSKSRKTGVVSAIKAHLLPSLDGLLLSNVKKAVIDQMLIIPLQSEGLKPSTIRQYFAVLKRVFASANELGLITVNPMANMKFSDHVQKRILPKFGSLQVQDAQQIKNLIMKQSSQTKMLLLTMLLFGTRIGETRQLKWKHVDLVSKRIIIPAELTKTDSTHVIPLTNIAVELFKSYKTECYGDYLFGRSKPLSASQAGKTIKSVSEGKFTAHDLRKLARSVWAEIGVDYWVAERLLNHRPKGLDLVYIQADSMKVKQQALEKYHNWLFSNEKTASEIATTKNEVETMFNFNSGLSQLWDFPTWNT